MIIFISQKVITIGLVFCMGRGLALSQNGCICPGHQVTYECTIVGGGTTVWNGSAFNCTSDQIPLRHSQFESGTAVGVCNDGAIVAHGIRRENYTFISQLNVTIEQNMIGRTIQCVYHDGIHITIVGSETILVGSIRGTVISCINTVSYTHLTLPTIYSV